MRKLILLFIGLIAISIIVILKVVYSNPESNLLSISPSLTQAPTPTPQINLEQPKITKLLNSDYHVFQTFNNCGPAALSMALSYYGIDKSQAELGVELRPYQNPQGDNDDKSVTLEELSEKSKEYNLVPYHRPNGNIEIIELFITYDIPVIARTLTKPNEDIGHYRVIKGYDSAEQNIIQDDSLQGKNLTFSYEEFHGLWKRFNYEYLVLVPIDKVKIVEQILGEDEDEKTAWQKTLKNAASDAAGTFDGAAENELAQKPADIYTIFNLSVAYYNIGEHQKSVEEFEKVEYALPFRTLWYQIEPILAFYELGNYDRVFEITDKVLNTYNRAFSELYILRGNIYKNQGNISAARAEYEKAVLYNTNLKSAQKSLSSVI